MGKKSRTMLSAVLRSTKGTISVAQAAQTLRLPPQVAAKILSRWAVQGWVSRVQRGLYVPVPLTNRDGDVALEDPWQVADQLFAPCYIGGWSAAEHWGLTEQIFRSILIVTARKPRDRRPVIKGTAFILRTVSPDAIFGTRAVWRGQVKVQVSDPERTILDMMDAPSLGGGIRPATDVLQNYLISKSSNLSRLIDYGDRLSSGAAFKRLGFLLERFAPAEREAIAACRGRITKGNTKLDPALPADRLVTAWRLWVPGNWKESKEND